MEFDCNVFRRRWQHLQSKAKGRRKLDEETAANTDKISAMEEERKMKKKEKKGKEKYKSERK